MKAIVFSFLIVVVVAVSVHAIDQSRIMGAIRPGDSILGSDAALRYAKPGQAQVYNYKYPQAGSGAYISCIQILDRWYNGSNGDVYLNSGGVGATSVSLSVRSMLGYGLQYDIKVWGR